MFALSVCVTLEELLHTIVNYAIIMPTYTVEPLNKGHFGSRGFVLFSEVVLWWEVQSIRSFIDITT